MKRLTMILTAAMLAMLMGACSDSLDPDDGDDDPVITEHFETVDNGGGAMTTTLTAPDDIWVYFRLSDSSEAEPANPADADDYDLGIQFANINLNGGVHGGGDVELLYFDDGGYEALTQAPGEGYITDVSDDDMGRAFNQGAGAGQNGGWYNYTGPPDHQLLIVENRYYVVHSVDDGYFKLRITGFASGGPGTPFELVFDWQEIDAP